jgi:CSLREA domain-containing protein
MHTAPHIRIWRALALFCGALALLYVAAVLVRARPLGATAASIMVTTANDDASANGNCTLREAIRAANLDQAVDACQAGAGADTITLPAGTYVFALGGSDEDAALTGDLDIAGDLTITGAASATTVIDAAAVDRVFDIHGGHVLLRNLTLRHGRIWGYSMALAPHDVSGGGGILVRSAPTSSLELVDSAVTDNHAVSGPSNDYTSTLGGGIYSVAPLTVSGSLINDNAATLGGGIYSAAPLAMSRSECRNNSGNSGGCIATFGRLTVTDSLITGSNIYGGPPTELDGGGIYAYGGESHISGSTISGHPYGGGIVLIEGNTWITNTLVVGNRSTANGGGGITNHGRLRLSGSAIVGNRASDYRFISLGGGIFNRGELIVATSLISGNSAAQGGGLLNWGWAALSDSAIINNAALIDSNGGEELAGYGGGAYNSGAIVLTNVTVSGNSAQGSGGGLANASSSQMILGNSTVTANLANRAESQWLTRGDAGGVYAGSPVSITNSLIAGNSAPSGVKPDAAGTLLSGGHNLIGNSAGVTLTGNLDGNLLDVAARLGPLSADGGLPIHPLLPGSPAVDAGSPLAPGSGPAACAPADARGVLRPLDGDGDGSAVCEIGAVEAAAVTPTATSTPMTTPTATTTATPPTPPTNTATTMATSTATTLPAATATAPLATPRRLYMPLIANDATLVGGVTTDAHPGRTRNTAGHDLLDRPDQPAGGPAHDRPLATRVTLRERQGSSPFAPSRNSITQANIAMLFTGIAKLNEAKILLGCNRRNRSC